MNSPLKPSGPEAQSVGMLLTVLSISSGEKAAEKAFNAQFYESGSEDQNAYGA